MSCGFSWGPDSSLEHSCALLAPTPTKQHRSAFQTIMQFVIEGACLSWLIFPSIAVLFSPSIFRAAWIQTETEPNNKSCTTSHYLELFVLARNFVVLSIHLRLLVEILLKHCLKGFWVKRCATFLWCAVRPNSGWVRSVQGFGLTALHPADKRLPIPISQYLSELHQNQMNESNQVAHISRCHSICKLVRTIWV